MNIYMIEEHIISIAMISPKLAYTMASALKNYKEARRVCAFAKPHQKAEFSILEENAGKRLTELINGENLV